MLSLVNTTMFKYIPTAKGIPKKTLLLLNFALLVQFHLVCELFLNFSTQALIPLLKPSSRTLTTLGFLRQNANCRLFNFTNLLQYETVSLISYLPLS